MVGEWIEKSYGISYTRSALIKLLKRVGMEYRKPKVMPSKLDPAKQQEFIEVYQSLLNRLGDDEASCSPTRCIRRTRCGLRAVGHPKTRKLCLNKPAGGNA